MNLIECADKFNKTDKQSRHNYLDFYETIFKSFDNYTSGNLLEIGIETGDSLRMWKERFQKFQIYGFDINEKYLFREERINTFSLNATSKKDVDNILNNMSFDLIIDDGSHRLKEQLESFEILFSYVKRDGYYCIEDFISEDIYFSIMKIINKYKISYCGLVNCSFGPYSNDSKILFIKKG